MLSRSLASGLQTSSVVYLAVEHDQIDYKYINPNLLESRIVNLRKKVKTDRIELEAE